MTAALLASKLAIVMQGGAAALPIQSAFWSLVVALLVFSSHLPAPSGAPLSATAPAESAKSDLAVGMAGAVTLC